MADLGFKHITVNAADQDDVVIRAGVAGIAEGAPGQVSDDVPTAVPAAEPASKLTGVAAGDGGAVRSGAAQLCNSAELAQGLGGSATRSQVPGTVAGVRSGHPAKRPYEPTTLEDLEHQPMPAVQKAVIIAAVICIIGAVIYYFVCMR